MCGFVGIFGKHNKDRIRDELRNSLKLISHRGPDNKKIIQINNLSVGFSRLSIQDLSNSANQPMYSEDKRYVILFNGEIYNFKKIKKDMLKKDKNLKFVSSSDTEVLLNLYILKGHKMLNELEGIFSLIIFDKKKNYIFISRDRFGLKPLYYILHKQNFIFSSEMKGFLPLIQKLQIPWKINKNLVLEYLTYRCNVGENTLIDKVRKFKNGNYAFFNSKGKFKTFSFFSPKYNSFNNKKIKINSKNIQNYIKKLDNLFSKSIDKQMISDAPLGICLSGGLDSSLILNYAASKVDYPIQNFHINFKTTRKKIFSEKKYAKTVAKKYKCKLKIIDYDLNKYIKDFKDAVWFNDEPLSIPHAPALCRLSKIASRKVKVLLAGEGADDIFAGYNMHKKNPRYLKEIDLYAKDKDMIRILNYGYRNFNPQRIALQKKIKRDKVNSLIIYNLDSKLSHLLNRLDKMSMAGSIEARAPFLDEKLFEFSKSLPTNLKIQNKSSKYIIKKLSEKFFAKKFIYRKKIGFSMPLNEWMKKSKFKKFFLDILLDPLTLSRGIYNPKELTKLIKTFNKGSDRDKNSYANKIWVLVNFELWMRMFIDKNLKIN